MLLDEVLPEFHIRASYGTQVVASPERVYASIWTADFDHWGLMRALFILRGLPGLLAAPRETWRRVRAQGGRRRVRLEDVLASGFTLLGEQPGEEVVLGTVGRFWLARGELRPVSPESFREVSVPGTAKAAWNFAVHPGTGGRTVLTTETRVLCADHATRRRFRTYWAVIGPFSGLIRREMLAAIRHTAEAASNVRAAMTVRAAEEAEIDHLAKIWYEGWHDAHARILPAELTRLRTLESFRDRLQAALPNIRVVGPFAAPVGFCILKGNEVYQLYVSAHARGSGVAAALMADAEARLAEEGFESAWLACAIGNERAARFYDKCGWRRVGTVIYQADASGGTLPLEVWRYEKHLRAVARR